MGSAHAIMSTNAAIIMKTPDGYAGIYCHFDGYLAHVGKILHLHYQDPQKVSDLIALGDISLLGPELEPTGPHSLEKPQDGVTMAYHRDRGEPFSAPVTGPTAKSVARIVNAPYAYVFEDGKWTFNGAELGLSVEGYVCVDLALKMKKDLPENTMLFVERDGFFETYGDDARIASAEVNGTLFWRADTPVLRVHRHPFNDLFLSLNKRGFSVAITNPKLLKKYHEK